VAEIVVRIFFSMLHFIMMSLLETQFDFYQFRWLVCLFINQILILFSINVNPLHSLILLGVLTYPLMSVLKVQDLRKVDPFNQVIRVKGEYEEDEILPTAGLRTHSEKWQTRQVLKEIGWDILGSLMMLGYLLRMREWLTPDFFHFVMCVGEDACHSFWTFFLWLSYKCFYLKAPA
jgi:hypothetical protein